MKKRTKKGFTLIELIVVIAILAILAVIAIPVVTGLVGDARTNAAEANARTIELAAKAWMTDNDDDSLSSVDLLSALSEYGIPEPIGGTTNFTVTTSGAVSYSSTTGGNGTITMAP